MTVDGEESNIAIKEFIDGFFLCKDDKNKQKELIEEKPDSVIEATGLLFGDVVLAGLVEQISSIAEISPPEWVFESAFYFDEPVFTSRNLEIQKMDVLDTPSFYSTRNLFCGNRFVSAMYNKNRRSESLQNL